MSSLKDRIFGGDKPIYLGPVSPPPRSDDSAFERAFEELKPGKVWRVDDPTSPKYIGPHLPGPALTALAEKIFVESFQKQDSLICDPDELAEKAWQLAEAFARSHQKRIK